MKKWIIIAVVLVAVLSSLAFVFHKKPDFLVKLYSPDTKIFQKDPILEINRLTDLAEKKTITDKDLVILGDMIPQSNSMAKSSFNEIRSQVSLEQYVRVVKGLKFLSAFLQEQTDLLCPGNSLLRYYFFQQIEEYELADGALGEAEEHIPDWIPKAQLYLQQNPNGEDFDTILNFIQGHINQIEMGNSNITDEEIDYLETKASICVEAD